MYGVSLRWNVFRVLRRRYSVREVGTQGCPLTVLLSKTEGDRCKASGSTVLLRRIVHALWCVTPIVHWTWCSQLNVMRDGRKKMFIGWGKCSLVTKWPASITFGSVHWHLWCVMNYKLVQFTPPCDALCEWSVIIVQYSVISVSMACMPVLTSVCLQHEQWVT